jgi:hypothetical protein
MARHVRKPPMQNSDAGEKPAFDTGNASAFAEYGREHG